MANTNAIEMMSSAVANGIRNVKGLNDDEYEVVKYGWYVLIANVLKIIIMLCVSYALGVFKYMAVTFIAFGLLRSFAGGVHADGWLKCLIVNSIGFFGVVYASILMASINPLYFIVTIYPACLYMLYKYSPADHHNRPMGETEKKRSRILTFVVFAASAAVSIITPAGYTYVILFSVFLECLMILPVTYRLTKNEHGDKYVSSESI